MFLMGLVRGKGPRITRITRIQDCPRFVVADYWHPRKQTSDRQPRRPLCRHLPRGTPKRSRDRSKVSTQSRRMWRRPPRRPLSNEVVSLEQDVILSPGAKAEAHADQEPIRRDDPACAGESVDRDNDRRRSGPRVTRPSERCGSQEALIFNGLMRMGTVNRKRSTLNAQHSTLNIERDHGCVSGDHSFG